MRVSLLAGALTSFTTLTSAALLRRQNITASTVANVGGWVETITVRQNGNPLLARIDTPELWTIDLSTKKTSKLISIPGALGLTGITEISPDQFVVVAGNFSATTFDIGIGSWAVYKVDLSGATPSATLITKIPESGFVIGAAKFDSDTVFLADAGKGSLYRLSVSTRKYSVAFSDPTMKAPAGSFIDEGIHGIKYFDGHICFTNTFGSTFNKVKLDGSTGEVSGPVIPITTSGLPDPEDFVIAPDGTAYVATFNNGVYRVSPKGEPSKYIGVGSQSSSVAFGRLEGDKDVVYISSNTGDIFSAKVN